MELEAAVLEVAILVVRVDSAFGVALVARVLLIVPVLELEAVVLEVAVLVRSASSFRPRYPDDETPVHRDLRREGQPQQGYGKAWLRGDVHRQAGVEPRPGLSTVLLGMIKDQGAQT